MIAFLSVADPATALSARPGKPAACKHDLAADSLISKRTVSINNNETERSVMETVMAATTLIPVLARLRFLGTLMLGAYLLINALLLALAPLTSGWPIWSVTALAVPPMVLGMVYLVMPLARRMAASGTEARS